MNQFKELSLSAKQPSLRHSTYAKAAVTALVVTATAAANAAMDTTSITDAITTALAAIAIVGAAVLGVHVAVKAYRWVRAAMA